MALVKGGGFGTWVEVEDRHLMEVPEGWGVEAGGFVEAGLTAFMGVWEAGGRRGERVLVWAGGSGVGTAAVGVCRAMGLEMVALTSRGKLEKCRALGVEAFDYG
jgi:NADPH:quinone reductase-like Zn-dependent oxidoreductase